MVTCNPWASLNKSPKLQQINTLDFGEKEKKLIKKHYCRAVILYSVCHCPPLYVQIDLCVVSIMYLKWKYKNSKTYRRKNGLILHFVCSVLTWCGKMHIKDGELSTSPMQNTEGHKRLTQSIVFVWMNLLPAFKSERSWERTERIKCNNRYSTKSLLQRHI